MILLMIMVYKRHTRSAHEPGQNCEDYDTSSSTDTIQGEDDYSATRAAEDEKVEDAILGCKDVWNDTSEHG